MSQEQQDHFINCMECGIPYNGMSQFCSRACMNSTWFDIPKFVTQESDSDTIELEDIGIVESINQRQGHSSPSKIQTSIKIVIDEPVTVAKVKETRALWRHKNIFIGHHIEGDTIVIHDDNE